MLVTGPASRGLQRTSIVHLHPTLHVHQSRHPAAALLNLFSDNCTEADHRIVIASHQLNFQHSGLNSHSFSNRETSAHYIQQSLPAQVRLTRSAHVTDRPTVITCNLEARHTALLHECRHGLRRRSEVVDTVAGALYACRVLHLVKRPTGGLVSAKPCRRLLKTQVPLNRGRRQISRVPTLLKFVCVHAPFNSVSSNSFLHFQRVPRGAVVLL